MASVTPEALTRTVQDYLSQASGAVVLEDGSVVFDLGRAKYSISGEHNKCLLHLWSVERNTVRRGLHAGVKNGAPRLALEPLGQWRPTQLHICPGRDRGPPSPQKAAPAAHESTLGPAPWRPLP